MFIIVQTFSTREMKHLQKSRHELRMFAIDDHGKVCYTGFWKTTGGKDQEASRDQTNHFIVL